MYKLAIESSLVLLILFLNIIPVSLYKIRILNYLVITNNYTTISCIQQIQYTHIFRLD
jgi:hypothetical protein